MGWVNILELLLTRIAAAGAELAVKGAAKTAPARAESAISSRITDISDLSRWWNSAVNFMSTKGAEFLVHITEALRQGLRPI